MLAGNFSTGKAFFRECRSLVSIVWNFTPTFKNQLSTPHLFSPYRSAHNHFFALALLATGNPLDGPLKPWTWMGNFETGSELWVFTREEHRKTNSLLQNLSHPCYRQLKGSVRDWRKYETLRRPLQGMAEWLYWPFSAEFGADVVKSKQFSHLTIPGNFQTFKCSRGSQSLKILMLSILKR